MTAGSLIALGNTLIQWYTEDSTFIRLLLFSNLEGHELKDLFHERSHECFNVIATYIDRRIAVGRDAAGEFDASPARAFFGMVAHYALIGLIFGCAPFNEIAKGSR